MSDKSKNNKRFISLKLKFSIFLSVFLIILMIVTRTFIVDNIKPYLINELKKKADALATNLAATCLESILTGDEMLTGIYLDKVMNDKSVIYAGVYDNNKRVIAHTDLKVVKGSEDNTETFIKEYQKEKKYSIYNISIPMFAKKKKIGYVRMVFSDEEIQRAISNIKSIISKITLIVLLIGIILSILSINYSLRPLTKLSEGVKKVGEGNLDYKVEVSSNDELGKFAEAFNLMTDNLKKAQAELVEKEKIKHELEIAHKIQISLLPKETPKIPNFEIATLYKSAKEVGGDYYDFIRISDNKLGIIITDVSGKGVPGALGMTAIRSILRSSIKSSTSLKESLIKANMRIKEDVTKSMFVTVGYLILDANKTYGIYSECGHLPLVYIRNDGNIDEIKTNGIAMGLSDPSLFEKNLSVKEININKGEILVLYTDGINEAMNNSKEEFGMERFIETLKTNKDKTAEEIVNAISNNIKEWTGNIDQSDDMTVIVIKCV